MKTKKVTQILSISILSLILIFTGCKRDDPAIRVNDISLNKSTINLIVGETESLVATITPEDATNKKVNWTSSNSDVAAVDGNGKVIALKEGKATISVVTDDGAKTASCTVNVNNNKVAVTGVSIDPESLSLVKGSSEQLTAKVKPENADNKKVSWSSDKTDIVTVDNEGNVKGINVGKAKITVTTEDGEKTATCEVTVTEDIVAVTGVKLNKTSLSLEAGKGEQLKATVEPENATNKDVKWMSDKTDIATVDEEGNIEAIKEGKAKITVTTDDGGKTATCEVTVKAGTISVSGVKLNKTALNLEAGKGEQLKATVEPENATNKNIKWKSDKTDIATVDDVGNVKAIKEGTAVITVTTDDGGKTATCELTVEKSKNYSIILTKIGNKYNVTNVLREFLGISSENAGKLLDYPLPTSIVNNISYTRAEAFLAALEKAGATAHIVETIPVASVKLNKSSTELLLGNVETLKATINPSDATDQKIEWSSSDQSVVSVDDKGMMKALKTGSATITVTTIEGKKTASCNVTSRSAVKFPNNAKVLDDSNFVFIDATKSLNINTSIRLNIVNTNGTAISNSRYTKWSSSNTKVATVTPATASALAELKALAIGQTTIVATDDDGKKIYFTLNVLATSTLIDQRDQNLYNTLTLGNQVWMKDNLRYLPHIHRPSDTSYTHPRYYLYGLDDASATVATVKSMPLYKPYGILYNWTAVMSGSKSSNSNPSRVQGICPKGWHVPSKSEVEEMENYLGSDPGLKLKNSGFISNYPGALSGGKFQAEGVAIHIWTCTEFDSKNAYDFFVNKNYNTLSKPYYFKDSAHTVRCVKDK